MQLKEEIFRKLDTFLGDEKKIEFLENLLKKELDNEAKKFIMLKIAELYEKKNLYNSSLHYLLSAATLADKWSEKIPLLMKITQIYIKLFDFINAEDYFKQAIEISNLNDIERLRQEYINYYLKEAKFYEQKNRYRKAIKFYEFLANKGIERYEMLNKVADLYELAAMPVEAGRIRRQIQFELESRQEKAEEQKRKALIEESRAERLV